MARPGDRAPPRRSGAPPAGGREDPAGGTAGRPVPPALSSRHRTVQDGPVLPVTPAPSLEGMWADRRGEVFDQWCARGRRVDPGSAPAALPTA